MYPYEGCGSDGLSSTCAFEMVREGNLEGTPSEGLLIQSLPMLTQSGQVGNLSCIMRVTHCTNLGAFIAHCRGLNLTMPAELPLQVPADLLGHGKGSPRFPN